MLSEPTFNIDQNLSLYIPIIDNEVAKLHYIRNVFHLLNIGDVKRVEFKIAEYGNTLRAFVHFNHWYQNICVSNLQERILGEKGEGRIVYDDPKFWILKKNTNPIVHNYAKQIQDIHEQSIKNYNYLLQYTETVHTTIYKQANIINNLLWWNNLHECNIKYLCEQLQIIKDERNEKDNTNCRDLGGLRKRTHLDYSEC